MSHKHKESVGIKQKRLQLNRERDNRLSRVKEGRTEGSRGRRKARLNRSDRHGEVNTGPCANCTL